MSNIQTHNQANAEAAMARVQAEIKKIENARKTAGSTVGAIVGGLAGSVLLPGPGTALGSAIGSAWVNTLVGLVNKLLPKRDAWHKFSIPERHDIVDGLVAEAVWVIQRPLDNAKIAIQGKLQDYDIIGHSYDFFAKEEWALNRLKYQIKLRQDTVEMVERGEAEMRKLENDISSELKKNISYKAIAKLKVGQAISNEEKNAIMWHRSNISLILAAKDRKGARVRTRSGVNP